MERETTLRSPPVGDKLILVKPIVVRHHRREVDRHHLDVPVSMGLHLRALEGVKVWNPLVTVYDVGAVQICKAHMGVDCLDHPCAGLQTNLVSQWVVLQEGPYLRSCVLAENLMYRGQLKRFIVTPKSSLLVLRRERP